MITASLTRQRYVSLQQHLEFLQSAVKQTLASYADAKGWAVLTRVKALDSLSEKIESGRFRTWSELDDLVAATLVVPTIVQEDEALDFLNRAFTPVRLLPRGSSQKAPDTFRFDSTRFIGLLPRPADIDPNEIAYKIPFEVQIRTAFEHAWSVATHSLTYKNDSVSWERLRLAAQLKSTVEQLDTLILAFEQTSKMISRSEWPEIAAKAKITEFFKKQFNEKILPIELTPKDWSRFADNIYAMVRSASNMRGKKPDEIAAITLTAIEPILFKQRDSIPRSVSLIQFVFATLWTTQTIRPPFSKYVPLITEELEDLFTELRGLNERFDYEVGSESEPLAPDGTGAA